MLPLVQARSGCATQGHLWLQVIVTPLRFKQVELLYLVSM